VFYLSHQLCVLIHCVAAIGAFYYLILILLSLTSHFVFLLKFIAKIHQVNIFTIHCVRF